MIYNIHKDKLLLDKVHRASINQQITLICPIHGEFNMLLSSVIHKKRGCVKCNSNNIINQKIKHFIDFCKIKHNNRYDYDLINQHNFTKTTVPIICSKHGQFNQQKNQHKSCCIYNDQIVAVMCFNKPRKITRNINKSGVFELTRFATDINYRIPGIASKLLNVFINSVNCVTVYSYANRRFGDGNLYNKLNFMVGRKSNSGYFYAKDGKRFNRVKFMKHKLNNILKTFDSSISEYDNMINNDFIRIWDCGTVRYQLNINRII